MKIAFVWTGFTSYMADCWRRLAAETDVELRVWIEERKHSGTAFDPQHIMHGIRYSWDWSEQITDIERHQVEQEILDFSPDVLFAVGWSRELPPYIVASERLKTIPKICCFDMPWRWKPRCLLAPLVLGRFLRHYQAAFVPGTVCERYAKWLGFKKIYKGLFAIDTARFVADGTRKCADYFLYIGRNSHEKRINDLRKAYAEYRAQGGRMKLKLYGKGLEGGFVKPEDVPRLMRNAAAFVLASDFDPWPLVLLEAMSAGCPIIASNKCTNRPELGKNWRVFRVGDVKALTREFFYAEAQSRRELNGDDEVERCLRENMAVAHQYDCGEWVKRVKKIVEEAKK